MKLKAIKKGILALPDKEIKPLVEWLRNYYDGPVWDRQIDADFGRLGAEECVRRLTGEESTTHDPIKLAAYKQRLRETSESMELAERRRLAALRLLNRIPFPNKAARTRMKKDFECVLGESLDNRIPFLNKAARARMEKDFECMLGESLDAAVERPTPKQSSKS